MSKVRRSDTDESHDQTEPEDTDCTRENYTIPEFTVQSVDGDGEALVKLNEFFNSSPIKSELHWFTHRETLERAARRDDRRLFYIAPGNKFFAGLMIWCESRVLEPEEAQIRLVAVDRDYRDYGLGSYLVETAREFAQALNKSILIADVSADSPAVQFWRSCDFQKTEEYQTDSGRTMFRMRQRISPQNL